MSAKNASQEEKLARLAKAQNLKNNVMLKGPGQSREASTVTDSNSFEAKLENSSNKSSSGTTSIWIRKSVVEKIDELMDAYEVRSRAKLIEIFTADEE